MTDRRVPLRREESRTSWSKSLWSSGTSQQGEPANFAFEATVRQSEGRSGSICFQACEKTSRSPTGVYFRSVVVEIGPGVRDLVVGDRVAIEPGVPCWTNRASR